MFIYFLAYLFCVHLCSCQPTIIEPFLRGASLIPDPRRRQLFSTCVFVFFSSSQVQSACVCLLCVCVRVSVCLCMCALVSNTRRSYPTRAAVFFLNKISNLHVCVLTLLISSSIRLQALYWEHKEKRTNTKRWKIQSVNWRARTRCTWCSRMDPAKTLQR